MSTTSYEVTHPLTATEGISPKAILALLYPVLAAVATALGNWIIGGGTFDMTEIKIAAVGVLSGGIAALGAYLGHPGKVTHVDVGTPSDQLLAEQGVLEKIKASPPGA